MTNRHWRRITATADLLFWSKIRPTLLSCLAAWIGMRLTDPAFAQSMRGALAMLGVFLIGSGANAWNEFLEVREDRKMIRTMGRPLPSGRVSARVAFVSSAFLSFVGLAALAPFGRFAVLCGLGILVSYVGFYTPLKRFTPVSFFVGAIGGSMPPLLGASMTSPLSFPVAAAWMTALLYAWQLPHFVAIARLHSEDYARGEMKVLGGLSDSPFSISKSLFYLYLPALAIAFLSLWPYWFSDRRVTLPTLALAVAAVIFLIAVVVFQKSGGTKFLARVLLKYSVVHLALILIVLGQFSPF